jgi:hypothetical protein
MLIIYIYNLLLTLAGYLFILALIEIYKYKREGWKMIKCDKCKNYKVSLGGCTSCCFENLSDPHYLTRYYFENRESGKSKTCKAFKPITEGWKMNDIKYPEEKQTDHVEYVLKKYLNKQLCYKAIFSQLDDGKLERILNDIKGESPWKSGSYSG